MMDKTQEQQDKQQIPCVYNVYLMKCSADESQCYVGSTKLDLTLRLRLHKNTAKYGIVQSYVYQKMRELNPDTFIIESLETLTNVPKNEVRAREEHYRQRFNPPLNTNSCYISIPKVEYVRIKAREYNQRRKNRQIIYNEMAAAVGAQS